MFITKSISRITFAAILTTAAFASGCSQQPAKAPGSNPEDMSPEGHRAAAAEEEQKAAEHRQEGDAVPPSKPMMEGSQKAQHEQKAEKHDDYAEQHKKAAEESEKK
jgi:hypothetical protein